MFHYGKDVAMVTMFLLFVGATKTTGAARHGADEASTRTAAQEIFCLNHQAANGGARRFMCALLRKIDR